MQKFSCTTVLASFDVSRMRDRLSSWRRLTLFFCNKWKTLWMTLDPVNDLDCPFRLRGWRLEKGRQYFGRQVGNGHIGLSPSPPVKNSACAPPCLARRCRRILGISEASDQERHHHAIAIAAAALLRRPVFHQKRKSQNVHVSDILVRVYRALHGAAPQYLSDHLQYVADLPTRRRGRLRSSTASLLLDVRSSRCVTVGDRSFATADTRLWNSLPADVRSASSLTTFRQQLKTRLFRK